MNSNTSVSRVAVSLFFFVNGFLHANLMARLPLYQSNLGISNSVLGALLFSAAIGALLGMPLTGNLAGRFGSDKVVRVTAVLFCIFLPLITFFDDVRLVGVLFLFMGVSTGAMDVCMNAQAVLLERRLKKPVMSSFHATFSIGMSVGAGVGALFSGINLPLEQHMSLMALLCLLVILWASGWLVHEQQELTAQQHTVKKGFLLPNKAIVPLGLIAFCCMTGEGSMADWSAIYMSKVVGESKAFSAIAFGVYATGMTLGRLIGDYLTVRLGKRRLMVYDALFAISGLGMALAYVSPFTTLLGFFMVGLGVSSIVPIVFSTAGNTKGVNPSAGIAMATSIGYAGFFVGPPVIGFLADHFGLRAGLVFPLTLFCLMYLLVVKFMMKPAPEAGNFTPKQD